LRSAYDQGKPAQLMALHSLLDEAAFSFEDREAVRQATAWFATSQCGFSDCFIAAKHAHHECDFTATLDKAMRKLPGVQVI
jgi:predicted nucleic-acid-binding protein